MTALTRRPAWFLILVCLAFAGCGQKPAPAKSVAPAAAPASSPAPRVAPKPAPERPPLTTSTRIAPRPKPAAAPAPVRAEAARTGGTLHIDSDVPGAQVFIDRQYIGVTPVTAENVSPGAHQLNMSAQGYNGIAQSIDVEPGARDLMLRFKEVRLDASIDVVHKHRMGSCKGRLSATPQGLRYETTNKDDAFNLPLSSVESLEIDYLAKVLRVKLAKGKRYDFTDPEGNADRLFVFHRDVDKVRQQLKDNR